MTENHPRQHRISRLFRARPLPAWSLMATGILTGGLLGGAYGVLKAPTYTATSYVIAVPTEKSDTGSTLGFAQAYGRIATQLAVLGDAQVPAGVSVRTLRDHVRTATSPDAPMIAISASSGRPGQAVGMANAVARALTRQADRTKADTHVQLLQFSQAVKPTTPTSPPAEVTGLVGASAGGLLGGLALLVRPKRRSEDGPVHAPSVPGPAAAADAHGHL
ncbi:lipopolysaccharide biosynthesis protein [Streptomyces sp. NPDC049915]|uniref:lipopolysaccharide biosynthesis protein n=1 Tax=Streptomyces sp. NPDC049915 TaxID=3155510 RepID=UPI00343BF62C